MDIPELTLQSDRKRIVKWIFRFVASYLVLLYLSYLLLSQAQSSWTNTEVYWEEASGVAVDVDDSASLREAVRIVGERPTLPEGGDDMPIIRSLAVWNVLRTWVKVRESENRLEIAVMGQMEWVHAVLQAESQMGDSTDD